MITQILCSAQIFVIQFTWWMTEDELAPRVLTCRIRLHTWIALAHMIFKFTTKRLNKRNRYLLLSTGMNLANLKAGNAREIYANMQIKPSEKYGSREIMLRWSGTDGMANNTWHGVRPKERPCSKPSGPLAETPCQVVDVICPICSILKHHVHIRFYGTPARIFPQKSRILMKKKEIEPVLVTAQGSTVFYSTHNGFGNLKANYNRITNFCITKYRRIVPNTKLVGIMEYHQTTSIQKYAGCMWHFRAFLGTRALK